MGRDREQPPRDDGLPPLVAAAASAEGRPHATAPELLRAPIRIGSITKSLTAALALLLDAAGDFPLDAPCSDGLGISNPSLAAIGWRDVLAHTARLPLELDPARWRVDCTPPTVAELRAAAARWTPLPLPPGTWHYSNVGYGLLADALARATGATWEELLRTLLLEPLGLAATTVAPPPDRARGRRRDGAGGWREAPPITLGACAAAGELWSTLEDLLRWGDCLAGRRPEVLPATALRALTAPAAVAPGDGALQGLAVQTRPFAGRRRIVASGAMPGYACVLSVLPAGPVLAAWSADGLPLPQVERFAAAQLTALARDGALARADDAAPAAQLAPDTRAAPVGGDTGGAAGDRPGHRLAGRWWLDGQPVDVELRDGAAVARLGDGTALEPLFAGRPDGLGAIVDVAGDRAVLDDAGRLRWRGTLLTRAIDDSAAGC